MKVSKIYIFNMAVYELLFIYLKKYIYIWCNVFLKILFMKYIFLNTYILKNIINKNIYTYRPLY